MKKLIEGGKSRDEVIAAAPTKEFDAVWGDGFLKPTVWVGIVYDTIANAANPDEKTK